MSNFTWAELQKWLAVRVEGESRIPTDTIMKLTTDSRKVTSGDVYWVLRGERFDGHDFVDSAFAQGGIAAVVDRKWLEQGYRPQNVYVAVEDTGKAFLRVASRQALRWRIPRIAVAGSNGKTTTKEMIAAVMAHRGPVLKTEGNFNNHVGVPLTLLRIGAEHASAVVELGTSSPGELAPLSKAVVPSCAVLTNIGHEHMEFFHTLDAVRNEEITVTEGLRRGGTLVLNADDPYLQKVRTNARFKVRTFGITRGQVRALELSYDARGCASFRIGRTWFRLQVPGAHNVLNALAAISVGLIHRIPKSDMADRLSAFRAVEGRMNVLDAQGGFRVIDDCYNANPSSVRSALQILSGMQTTGRRIAVLGDMLELGEQTADLHRGIGAWAAEMAIDQLWCVGPLSANIAEAALAAGLSSARVHHTLDKNELETALTQIAAEGDVILVKASHGLHLETTVRKLVALAPAALSGDLS